MAAASVPAGRSLLGRTLAAADKPADEKPSRLAGFLAKAREHVVTLAALASADFGSFQVHIPHCGSFPGYLAVCASLLLADFAVRG